MSTSVLVTDYAWPSLDVEREILARVGARLVVAETGDEDELIALAADVDAILTCWKPVTANVLRAAPHCLTVARYGVGLDNIDVDVATELGIAVSNVPDFCTDEVADHTMALLLALARNVASYDGQTASGRWDNKEFGSMHRLRGRALGLVGYGRIARAVADRALAFGLTVSAYSPSRVGTPGDREVRFADTLEALLRGSDIVSLHVPATPTTHHIVDGPALSRFKPGALLLNTSRGSLIEETALLDALESGHIGGAGLDVLAIEPPEYDHPLRTNARTVLTPHAAFVSAEAVTDLQTKAARNVATVLSGGLPDATVNAGALRSPALRVGAVKS